MKTNHKGRGKEIAIYGGVVLIGGAVTYRFISQNQYKNAVLAALISAGIVGLAAYRAER